MLSVLFGLMLLLRPGAGALTVVWLIASFSVLYGVVLIAWGLHLRRLQAQGATLTVALRCLSSCTPTYTIPYKKSSVRSNSCSTALPGVAYAATKLTVKLSFSVQSVYQSSSVARLFEVTPGADWSSVKSKRMRPVLMRFAGLGVQAQLVGDQVGVRGEVLAGDFTLPPGAPVVEAGPQAIEGFVGFVLFGSSPSNTA